MSGSLFDQLRKSGLADKSQVHKARTEKQRQVKQKKNTKQTGPDETAQAIEQARLEKIERDRQLNAERKAEADNKALIAQIKQIIETHRQSKGVDRDTDDGVAYNFVEHNKVKTILVSKTVQQQLSRGRLAIVKLNEGYELLPKVVAEKIQSRAPDWCVVCNEAEETEDDDDPYKDYKIPDDLMW